MEPFTPLQYTDFVLNIGLENMDSKERLRAHIASVYLGDKQGWYYLSEVYPQQLDEYKHYHDN